MLEKDLQEQEKQFPNVSGVAFAAAREAALAAGLSVLQSENGVIFEVFPDGKRIKVKEIEPPSQIEAGKVFHIR